MVDGAAETANFQTGLRERNPTRAAMIAAARRIAERDGMPALSLSAVADEAGFARAAAYAQFSSRAELLSSVVAEDLGHLLSYLRSAAGLPEPQPKRPDPPSRVIRFELPPAEKRKQAENSATQDVPTPAESDSAPTEQHAQHDELAQDVSFGDPESFASHDQSQSHVAPASVSEISVAPVRPSDLNSWFWLTRNHEEEPTGFVGTALEPELHERENKDAVVAHHDLQLSPMTAADSEEGELHDSLDGASAPLSNEPLPANDAEDPGAEPTPEILEPAAPIEAAELVTATLVPDAPAEVSEPNSPNDETPACASGDKPVSSKLPSPDERILLVGPRTEATPDLRDVAKKLAPTNPSGAETPAEMIARLKDKVADFEAAPADRVEQKLVKFDRVLSSMEERFQRAEQASLETSSAFRESLKKLGERIEQTESRQRDVVLKIMGEVRDTARRVDELEFASRSSRMADTGPDHVEEHLAPLPISEEVKVEPMLLDRSDELAPDKNADPREEEQGSYLSAVRRAVVAANAAQAAAVAAEMPAQRAFAAPRTRIFVLGFALSALTLATIALTLNHAARDAFIRHAPSFASVVQPAPARHTAKIVAAAPLDQATARARAGDSLAELIIGLRYLGTDGQVRDDSKAFVWLTRSAASGDARAEYWLANLYAHGRGTVADPVKAFSFYEKAALQGHRKAMHCLAIAYAAGTGVVQNYADAARWFARAADLGYVDSAFNLAVLYERGDGVPQSLLDAYRWYGIASSLGDNESRSRMEAISGELPTDDRSAADAAIAAFKPDPLLPVANVDPTLPVQVLHH